VEELDHQVRSTVEEARAAEGISELVRVSEKNEQRTVSTEVTGVSYMY
jgi:hypothetical protein